MGYTTTVSSMLTLNKKLAEVKTDHDKKVLKRQIAATDNQIDNLVYELYNLEEKEIEIIEGIITGTNDI